jgi:hypothetical protein
MRRETEKLKKKIKQAPRIRKFRGRRVVHSVDWTWADWTKLPGEFIPLMINSESTPPDWYQDYLALMHELQDPLYGGEICWNCAIYQAQSAKKEIDPSTTYWKEEVGEASKEIRVSIEKDKAFQEVEWRVYNELGEANNRTCKVVNYFKCPYGEERRKLIDNGSLACEIWEHIKWYDHHWNNNHTITAPKSEMKWYHYGEPGIINVTSLDDIVKALDDGRFDKVVEEHERYMKETGRKIYAT